MSMTVLHRNPFWLLGATMRDDRQRIKELADEKSLSLDSETCDKAYSDLINPRHRLSTEMAWLPGVSPKYAKELACLLHAEPEAIKEQGNAPPLVLANLMAAAFELLAPEMGGEQWADWIIALAITVDEIDAMDILRDINEDRAVAGFPEVKALDMIESELSDRRRYYKDAIMKAINRLPPMKLMEVVTVVVDGTTSSGAFDAPVLIDDVVDSYTLDMQGLLRKEADNVLQLVESAKQAAPTGEQSVEPLLNRLEAVVRNWDRIAQPIQLSRKSRGLHHDMSHELAYAIRGLGIYLYNEHGMLDAVQKLTTGLQEVFAELPEVAALLDEDAKILADLVKQRQEAAEQAKRQAEEWAEQITFQTDLGVIFKNTLAISPRGVQWKDTVFPLESVTRVRWGGTLHSVNGVPRGTTYTVCFGDQRTMTRVETNKEAVYTEFIDKLWRAVGVRLLTEMLDNMAKGTQYRFGETVVDDQGLEVIKHKFFRSNERIYCKWGQLVIWNGPGTFCVSLKEDKNFYIALSYLEVDNVHILESAIRMLWNKGGPKLSGLLEG
jgi:hypothetical protein